jgi:outer membrane protein OmpA-like peptidoglycan-associated protein
MPSVTALRALLGASLGLGAIDLLWIDLALAPKVLEAEPAPAMAAVTPAPPPPAVTPTPAPAAAPAPAPTPAPAPAAPEPDVAITPAADPPADPPADPSADPPTDPPADPPVDPPAVTTETVYFATRSDDLDTDARATLDALAARAGTFTLEGHADMRGRERFNEALSRRRALAVQSYLAERGVDADRIDVRYVGEDAATAADDGELWRDRRVDIQITGGPR